MEADIQATEIRMNALSEELAQTQHLAQQSSYELSTVRAQLLETESQHNTQLLEIESQHNTQLLEIESQRRLQLVEIESLALDKEREKNNTVLIAMQEAKIGLELEIVTLNEALSAAVISNTNITSEMNEITQHYKDIIQNMSAEIHTLQVDLDDVRRAKQLVTDEHTTVHDALLALQTKFDASIVELQEAQKREMLAVELSANLEQNAKVQNEAIGTKLQADLDQSRAALDQSKVEISMMAIRNNSLEGELKDVRVEIIALETQSKEHLHQLELARIQYMEDKDTIAHFEREKQSLLNELEKSRTQALKNQTQATEDHAAAVAVRVENAVLMTKNDTLAIDLSRMKEQSDNLLIRVDTLQKERDEMKALVSSTEGNLKVQLAILTTRNEGLSAEIERIKHSEAWKAEADIKSRDAMMTLTTEKMTTVAELDKIKVNVVIVPITILILIYHNSNLPRN